MQKRAEETRAKLLEAGQELIARDGFHNTSSKKIAAHAGVAIGSFYNHFPDKKALLIGIFTKHVQEVHSMVLETLEREDFTAGGLASKELVSRIVNQAMELHHFHPSFHKQMSALRYTDDEVAELLDAENERVIAQLIALLSSATGDTLRVADLPTATRVTVAAVEAVVHEIMVEEPSPEERRRRLDALADMIHRYLYSES